MQPKTETTMEVRGQKRAGAGQPLQVLLVEDNEIDVEIARRALEKCGLPVRLDLARDGDEALDALFRIQDDADASLPRVILLDLRLPATDGREVLRRIKRDQRLCAIPVVVLTGMSTERQMRECMELGTNMYFVKPITTDTATDILTAVAKYWTLMEGVMRKAA